MKFGSHPEAELDVFDAATRYVVLFEVRHDAVFIYSVTHASRPPSAATRRIRDEKSKE